MITRTKIKDRKGKKSNTALVELINLALKNKNWQPVAQVVSASTRQFSSVNLGKIDAQTSNGDTVVVIGKVLGAGELTKKVRICALGFSQSALDKMKKTKSESATLMDEIKNNPKGEGIKLIQ